MSKKDFMPKAENVLKVIKNLEKVLPYANLEYSLNMEIPTVSCEKGENLCGTIQCHGGWYAVAAFSSKKRQGDIDYSAGADRMGYHLGFRESKVIDKDGENWTKCPMEKLMDWADKNPEIWGNEDGLMMFGMSGRIAFYHPEKRPNGAKNLQHIIDHWREVYERLLAIENPEEKREDITAKLAVLPVDETLDTIKTQVYETV